MLELRFFTDESSFLKEMVYESIFIENDKPPIATLLDQADLKKYYEAWGRGGDQAIILYDGKVPLCAAWYRIFSHQNRSYGYMDDETPELGIALVADARGKGYGKKLLKKLLKTAQQAGYHQISLSVDKKNESAINLYEKLGFKIYESSVTSQTMYLEL